MDRAAVRRIARPSTAGRAARNRSMPAALCAAATTLAVVVFLVGSAATAKAQQHAIKHYSNADGLPQAQVLSVFQDRRGYMWFGTYGGVTRFDGAEFMVLTSADGLVGNVVTAIAESRGGRIFFGTRDGVTVLDDGELEEVKGPGSQPIKEVRDIYADRRRVRWIATADGLFRHRGSEVVRYGEADGLPSASVLLGDPR